MRSGTGNDGFDAGRSEQWTEAGIIDPTRVVRVTLENAASVAETRLLAEATMTEAEEPRTENRTASAA